MKKYTEKEIRDRELEKHKDEVERITLLYPSNRKKDLFILLASLTLSVESGEPVPSEVIKELKSIITTEDELFSKLTKLKFSDVKKKIKDRFETNPKYNFDLHLKVDKKNRNSKMALPALDGTVAENYNVSLNRLVKYIFHFLDGNINILVHKNILCAEVHKIINNYFDLFNGDTKKVFSPYKRSVLTGYIAYNFFPQLSKDIHLMKGADVTNQQLHQAVKYYTTSPKK